MSAPNQLFQSMLSSEIKGDLLVLFHKNPGLIDSLDGVARRIGRVGTAIQSDVQDMVSVHILGSRQIGGREIIFLDRSGDKAAQESILNYLKNLKGTTEDRNCRTRRNAAWRLPRARRCYGGWECGNRQDHTLTPTSG